MGFYCILDKFRTGDLTMRKKVFNNTINFIMKVSEFVWFIHIVLPFLIFLLCPSSIVSSNHSFLRWLSASGKWWHPFSYLRAHTKGIHYFHLMVKYLCCSQAILKTLWRIACYSSWLHLLCPVEQNNWKLRPR